MEKVKTKLYGDYDLYANAAIYELNIDQQFDINKDAIKDVLLEFKPQLIVEIGSWLGTSAIYMAEVLKEIHDDFEIVCVDTWLGSVEHWTGESCHDFKQTLMQDNGRQNLLYKKFLSNVIQNNLQEYITPLCLDSSNAYWLLNKNRVQPDMIYIDASHDYFSVRVDLFNYSNLVKVGGCILGDDWHHYPIKNAVYDTFLRKDIVEKSEDKYLWIK